MGLDHGLIRRYTVKNWDFLPAEERDTITVKPGKKSYLTGLDPATISAIETEIITWRKANAIHNWFVENCNDGDDNNGRFDVSLDELKELHDTITKVLAGSKLKKGMIQNGQRSTPTGWEPIMEPGEYIEDPGLADELLPTTSGFFFGSTDYDEYYWSELVRTKEMLDKVLADKSEEYPDYEYWASW